MGKNDNTWLEKYEIKKPDYDYVSRMYIGMANAKHKPARYTKLGNCWRPKGIAGSLIKKQKVRLMFVGDITCFGKQFAQAKVGLGYDFNYEFDEVRPLFQQADLVVGNLETMIYPHAPYRSERMVSEQNYHCNAPIEFLDAIRRAGFDVLTNANNHDMDTGAVGIGETIDRVESFGFIQTGTFKTDKKRYELIDVSGFKIAIVAFATEHNHKRCNLTKEGAEFLLNDYSYSNASNIIQDARKAGAEKVFVCIHWGQEHKLVHNDAQREIAEELAELGYDCIIGSHPHVLQPFTRIVTDEGKSVPVFYSMGNFVSHNVNNQKARSVIACIDLVRSGKSVDLDCSYIPIFTSASCGKKPYVVVPIPENPVDSGNIKRKQQIEEVIGCEISVNQDVLIQECTEENKESGQPKKTKKASKPDPKTAKKFPIMYADSSFAYEIHQTHAVLLSPSEKSTGASYAVPSKVLGVTLKQLGDGAFRDNPFVKKINFPSTIAEIPENLCMNCRELEGFQLGNGIVEIKAGAFARCEKLYAAVMRRKVKRIGSKAFANCTSLRCVKIPASVQQIADDAFVGCPKVVFYCEPDSYGLQYAAEHGFKSVVMDLE